MLEPKPALVRIWRKNNNLEKLREHGLLESEPQTEPEPKPKREYMTKNKKRALRQMNQKRTKPISFRPTKNNYYFLEETEDKTKLINEALDKLRQEREL